MTKWLHKATISTVRGQAKINCSCGWQTKKRPVEESQELTAEHAKHTGLTEREHKLR